MCNVKKNKESMVQINRQVSKLVVVPTNKRLLHKASQKSQGKKSIKHCLSLKATWIL